MILLTMVSLLGNDEGTMNRYQQLAEKLKQQIEVKGNKPKTITLPSGTIIDEYGNILYEAPTKSSEVTQQNQNNQVKLDGKNTLIDTLTNEYNSEINVINQQILSIKNQYYIDVENINNNSSMSYGSKQGRIQILTDDANWEIQKLQTQQESLTLEYNSKINALK